MERLSAFLVAAWIGFGGLYAQTSDIVVFSDAGEKFTLIIDGEVKNAAPASRVVATGIKNTTPMLAVQFAETGIPPITQNGWMEPGLEYTLRITTNKKGIRVLRPQGQAPLGTAAAAPADKAAPIGFVDDAPTENSSNSNTQTTDVDVPGMQSSTTVTTTSGTEGQDVNVNLSINGMNVSMSVTDGMGGTSTTTTTEQHETAEGSNEDETAPTEQATMLSNTGCNTPMTTTDFADAKASIESKGFEETKLSVAKQIGGSNCLSATQVKTIMGLFGFEESKLEFAEFAYAHTTDVNNYYKVNDAFGFSSSVDELNEFIRSR